MRRIGAAPNVNWLFMNPVLAGYIGFADLLSGKLNLYDIFILNEVLKYKNKYDEELAECLKA